MVYTDANQMTFNFMSKAAPVSRFAQGAACGKGDAGNRGRPVRSEVAASTSLSAADRAGVGQGHSTVEAG